MEVLLYVVSIAPGELLIGRIEMKGMDGVTMQKKKSIQTEEVELSTNGH